MKILVVDVAAEHSGALTILNQFISEFEKDTSNEYYVVLSILHFQDRRNIHFINCEWVKKTKFHRLFFDCYYIKKLIKKLSPDRILSLQNIAVRVNNIPQTVYFQNILPLADKRFSFKESGKLWVYQNIIGRMIKNSLVRAEKVIVQAEWIKKALAEKWKINENIISVKRPQPSVLKPVTSKNRNDSAGCDLFYPANSSIYKNHAALLKACIRIWDKKGKDCGLKLYLTLEKEDLKQILNGEEYPVVFLGRLDENQMSEMYSSTILVFPSYMETFGLPLAEAQAFGCEILAADCEYAHETIGDYSKVRFFDPFDVSSIENAILNKLRGAYHV